MENDCENRFKKLSQLIGFCFLFADRVIYFWNKLPNQIENSNFWELSEELLNRIWSVDRYCINNVHFLHKISFYF